jgi:two-component system, OmpR family, response regulator
MHCMQPRTLALIDDDAEYSEYLAQHLRSTGIDVSVFDDSNTLLADESAHRYDFYLVDLMLPGVDGVELIKVIRRRSDAGLLVVSGRLGPEVFASVMTAGADMYLAKPVQFDQVSLAIQAVQRRAGRDVTTSKPWKLDREARELLVPDGARVALSDADLIVIECFIDAAGQTVTREALSKALGRDSDEDGDNGLNAIIYRLRRRIERATPMLVPLQSRSRVGYWFRAPLAAV